MHLLKLGVSFLAMGGATYAMIAIKELDPITRVLIWIPSIMAIILMMP